MRLLIAHNAYQHRGGEDVCVENESKALSDAGLDVVLHRVPSSRRLADIQAAIGAPFGWADEGRLEKTLDQHRPTVLHAHNLFPLLSPRLFRAARQRGLKTFLTLHNFRPLCMNGLFMTPKGEVCERCAPGNYWHGVWRRCYRSSWSQSSGMATHLAVASSRKWYDDVDVFIAPSQFLKDTYVAYGYPEKTIHVQGHFIPVWPEEPVPPPNEEVLYLGRLAEEKGLRWLVGMFIDSKSKALLNIAGDGPLRGWVNGLNHERIRYLGHLDSDSKSTVLRKSMAVVMASRCYESFSMVVAEANSFGVPAIVPNRGAMAENVIPGINGDHFKAEDPDSFWKAFRRVEQTFATVARRETLKSWARRRFSKEAFLETRLALYHNLASSP